MKRAVLLVICTLLAAGVAMEPVRGQTGNAPSAPTIDSVTVAASTLTVNWTAPSDTGAEPISSYDLRYILSDASDKSDDKWIEETGVGSLTLLQHTISGLRDSTEYDVQARAASTVGAGEWSAASAQTTLDHGDTNSTATTVTLDSSIDARIDRAYDRDRFKLVLTEPVDLWVYTVGDLDTRGRLNGPEGSGSIVRVRGDSGYPFGQLNVALRYQLEAGTYYILVDSYGQTTGPYTLEIRTASAPGTTQDTATTVASGVPAPGRISGEGDFNYFTFVLASAADVWIAAPSSDRLDTVGTLLDSNGDEIVENDNSNIEKMAKSFSIRRELAAGTYYIKVRASDSTATGAYTLFFEEVADYGSAATARPISRYSVAPGRVDAGNSYNYFGLTVAQDTWLRLQAYAVSTVFIVADVFDDQGNELPSYANLGGLRIEPLVAFLSPGSYRVRISEGGWRSGGAYVLQARISDSDQNLHDECSAVSSPMSDPLSGCQWHLHNTGALRSGGAAQDISVLEVWETTKGEGVNVAVVDTGMNHTHPDLNPNVIHDRNHDYYGGTWINDIFRPDYSTHGTSVAGLIAAVDNDQGMRGVAPRANIYGYNLVLSGSVNQTNEADAMTRNLQDTAVSNNSWGKPDNGHPHTVAGTWERAITNGVTNGYGGKGIAYVWAAGNGGSNDNSNLDGRANHYGLIAVCAINHGDDRAPYSERGANLWLCAPGGETGDELGIATTDRGGYTKSAAGTSFAVPIVSGVVALMRAANPDLTWRDVKLILAASARKNDATDSGWEQGALRYGSTTDHYQFNHEYGFGAVDAGAAVALAEGWTTVPAWRSLMATSTDVDLELPTTEDPSSVSTQVSIEGSHVGFVEFVEVNIDIDHESFRHLEFELVSHSGAVSQLTTRPTQSGFVVHFVVQPRVDVVIQPVNSVFRPLREPFRFGSARHLGENPTGQWTLRINDYRDDMDKPEEAGRLKSWSITVYGHGYAPGFLNISSIRPTTTSLTVNWAAPDDTGASAISGYDLRYIRSDAADKSSSNWTTEEDIWTSGALSYELTGLTGGVKYLIQMRASNDDGDGAWSTAFSMSTSESTPPDAPTIDSVTARSQEQATATVQVDSAGTVHLRFAPSGTTNWTSLSATASAPGTVEITLTGLTPNAVYDVQASQDSSFPSTAATQSVTFTNRPAHLDLALNADNPTGIWGNDSTLWVAVDHSSSADKRLYAYNRSDGSRDSGKDFETLSAAGNNRLGGIWSDGATMFVVDWDDDKVFAYGLSTRQRTAGSDLDLDGLNDNGQGIWGNASTLWVAEDHDRPDNKLYAYNRSDGSRDYAKDFDTLNSAGNQSVKGIWSDGSTMFVADFADKKLYGYHMGSRRRWARQDIDLVPENRNPKGVWGDDGKIWVANDGFGATNKVFAYYTPVVDTITSDISLSNVTGTSATATVWIAASDGTARTVRLRHREEASAAWTDAPSQMTSTVSTEFTLTGLFAGARYVVQASFDSTFSDGTEASAEFEARPQDQDFRLAAGNGDARGIWSDGTTLWVVNDGSGDDDRVYAYTVSSKAHDAGNSFDLDSGNTKPGGVYANADVMWVPDGDDDSVYAYTITSGNSYGDVDASKGFALHTGTGLADIIVPTGAWSDGSTLWVAGHVREQVYAYNIGSTGTFGARDMSKECELATDYASPRGTWSDGSTLWVVDSTEHRVFAYGITSDGCGERQLLREIRLADGNSDAWGIWSNGTTLWVADAEDDKVYAYTLPPAPSGDVTGLALDRITATAADITVTIANPDATERSVELTYEAASGGTLVTSTASTSDTSAEFNLAGLTANADYSLQVRVDSGSAVRTGGFRTQSSTDQLREYLKNTIVGGWETARPWVRETYNAMRRHHVLVVASELRLTAGLSGRISSSCFLAVGSELSKCFVREFHMDDRSVRHLGTLIHELAHVHTIGSGYADEPAEYLGMGWLYFRDLAEGGTDCDVSELYADGISYAHEPASQYYFDQCSNTGNMPSAATTEAVQSVLAGQTPDWFRDEYEGDGLSYDTSTDPKYDRKYDLERVWDDLLLLDSGSRDAAVAVYQFRNAFGGYCDPTEAYQAAFGFGTTRIPWRAGGCLPQAPAIDSVTGVVSGLTVAWSAPDGDAVVSSYDLRYIETSADETVETNWTVRSAVWTSGDLAATVTGLTVGTQYDVQVRAENAAGEGPWSATRMGTTALSDNATLSAMTLRGVRLTPVFMSGTTSYTPAVGYTVTRTTVAATTSNENATVEFLDGNDNSLGTASPVQVDLSVGENIITVEVTAQDGMATETYSVTVTRTEKDLSLTPPASDPVAPFASTATYTIRFRGHWTTSVTPDGRPGGVHFSRLIGAVHSADVTFLEGGGTASAGVESMAEVGGSSTLRGEVNTARNADPPTALSVLEGSTGSIGPTTTRTLSIRTLTTAFPRVTLTTMIAPSHDWFVGVSGLPLLDASGRWLRSHEVDLFPWDAGTEEGDNFSLSPSVATTPRGDITSIRGTGKFTTERIASLAFTLQSVRTDRSLLENTPAGVNIGPPVATAASSGTVSYSLGGTDAASFDLVDSGQLRTKAGVTYDSDTKSSYTVTVTTTDADGSIVATVDIAIENIDEPPEITGYTSSELAENRTGTVATYRARDPEGEPVTWLPLGGPDSGAFRLSASGALTFKAAPDYEAQAAYEVTLRASADGESGVQTGTLDVTVTVTDVDEPAEISFVATGGVSVNNNALTVDENHAGTLATFSANDPEQKPGLTYTWSLGGSDRGDFALTAAGVLSFVNIPDHERPADSGGNNVYDIAVNALDSDGKTGSIALTVTVDPVNEPPAITGDAAPSAEEEGTLLVGTYRATDPENATIAWQPLAGNDSDSFEFNTSTGRLSFKAAPDFEDPERRGNNVYDVTLGVSAGGHTITFDVAVTVTNKEEPGMLALPATQPQAEAGYTATLGDPDGVQSTTWTWERSTSRNGPWTAVIGAADSVTTSVYTPVTGDVGYYLRATAAYTDGHGPNKSLSAVSTNPVLAAPAVNSPPAFTEANPTRSIAENAQANAPVGGRVTATDPDPGNTVRYEFEPPGSDLFTIDGSSGQIRVKTQGSLDHDDPAKRTHTVTVKASDSSNASATIQVTIEVTDVNEPPDAVADAPGSFDEDTEITIDVLANDSDPEEERSDLLLTVFNSGTNSPRNGTVRVNEPANRGDRRTITYEPNADYNGSDTFTYQVVDTGSPSLSGTATVSLQIDAVNDAPTFPSKAATRSVPESAEAGDHVGAPVTAMDVDENDTLSYSLSGTGVFSFAVDAGGQITVGTGVTFDAATTPEYAVTVEARDHAGAPASVEVTITVTSRPVISGGGGGGPGGGGGGGGGPSGPSPSIVDFEWTVTRDIEALAAGHDGATGMWSNGQTLWLAHNGDGADDAVYAYDLASGERREELEFELDERNRAPRGVWSDRTVIWISDSGQDKLFAHDLASGERLPDSDLALHDDNDDPRGTWSDGATMWVLDDRDDALFGYDLASGALLAEYALHDDNDDPHGIWSDRVSVWVSDHGAKRLFAYRLPVLPDDEADSGGEDAEDGARELERVRDEEFPNTVLSKAGNNSPRGIWSDGDVMYVADASDDKVYSYNMPDAIDARLASLTLSGIDIGEFSPDNREYEVAAAEDLAETTVEAAAVQRGAEVEIHPLDADGDETNGHQVALEGVAEITVTVTSADGSRTRIYVVRFGEAAREAPSAACLRGDVAEGFSLVVYEGGSVEELGTCARSRHITALYATHDGVFVAEILGAPAFVNRSFRELYAGGVPPVTLLLAKSDGPDTAEPGSGSPPGDGAPRPWPECLRGDVATGFALVLYEGGVVEELVACAQGLGVTALYALQDGEWISYILGAPAFVNREFGELFADGLPAVTPLVAKSGRRPARRATTRGHSGTAPDLRERPHRPSGWRQRRR